MEKLEADRPPPESLFVLEMTGDLDLDTQARFESAVFGLLERGSVVVDLSRLDFLAISSLRSLVLCHRHARALCRHVVYAAPPAQARRLIAVARLDAVLPVQPSVAAACDQLSMPSSAVRATVRPGGDMVAQPPAGHRGRALSLVRRPEFSP